MSLRLRLFLVILAVVVPTSVANLVSNAIDRSIQRRVDELRREAHRPLDPAGLRGHALEIEGTLGADGVLAAHRLEELPRERRPKLRGRIQAADAEAGVLTLYGIPITVTAETEGLAEAGGFPWKPGQRVEASCRIAADGTWIARKVKSDDVKASDKVKGVVTAAHGRADGGADLELSGIRIRTQPGAVLAVSRGPLHRMETATQMTAAVQDGLAAAHELVKTRFLRREAKGDAARVAALKAESELLEERVLDGYEEFANLLAEFRTDAEDELAAAERAGRADELLAERARVERFIAPLEVESAEYEAGVQRLIAASGAELEGAQAFLAGTLEPTLRKDVLPRVHALELDAEEALNEDLETIGERSASAARWTLATNAVGLLLALSLGWFVSRSISRPVLELEAAARRVGEGDLSARVGIRTGDELGALADTFNRMAVHLSASTVSIGQLNAVIDSMAGALFLLGPDGAITSVNPAAAALLGYEADALVGRSFETVSPGDGARAALAVAQERGTVASELAFVRRDGRTIPVSFSAAVLRGDGRAVRGYVCLAEDQTERKRMDEALRRSLSEKELLLRELHHRVKNNLQVISSLLDLQSREISDPRALEKFQESQDRIRSMFLIHEQLYGASDLRQVDVRVYLGLLVENLAQAHVDPPGRIQVAVEIEDLRMDLDRSLSCGLIVNELVVNAMKHAFGPADHGTITVACRTEGDQYVLSVRDDGRGIHADQLGSDERLGQSLVRALCSQLHGTLAVSNGKGATFRITFPVRLPEERS
ncbi:MAG: PAS domain S-box protein [Planctomycetes bacterium]|nr:PAS domain S-box protein [Planctomycetota bacterium]